MYDTCGIFIQDDESDAPYWKITQVGAATGLQVSDHVTDINGHGAGVSAFNWINSIEGQSVNFTFTVERAGGSPFTLSYARA